MLHSLTIHNFLFISHLHLEFKEGFTVLTGETGAGKSILLDALNLVLGESPLSHHKNKEGLDTILTGIFQPPFHKELSEILENQGIIANEPLILRRLFSKEGRSRIFMNDQPIGLSLLRTLVPLLIEIHGQFDNLLDSKSHLHILDNYGNHLEYLTQLKIFYSQWKNARLVYEETQQRLSSNLTQEEWLKTCIEELDNAHIQENEEDTLLDKRNLLLNQEKLSDTLQLIYQNLTQPGSIENSINQAYKNINKLLDGWKGNLVPHIVQSNQNQKDSKDNIVPEKYLKFQELLRSGSFLVQDIVNELNDLLESVNSESNCSLEELESRLFTLRNIARKHGCEVQQLKEVLRKLREEYDLLTNQELHLEQLRIKMAEAKAIYLNLAQELNNLRKISGEKLAKNLQEELQPLKINYVIFQVNFQDLPENLWSENGTQRLEFWMSVNPGLEPAPLKQVASGGEISRIMLALKVILRDQNHIPTLVFDEIDTGLGGSIAAALGQRMSVLSSTIQIISITHSPQLAAYADHHWVVEKTQHMDKTTTQLHVLEEEDRRIEELARMLSGTTITSQSRAAASELRAHGNNALLTKNSKAS